MSSKRKVNGCTSVHCVEDAMKKSNCGVIEFFNRATTAEVPTSAFNVERAAELFTKFRHHGPAVYPHYEIPAHVLRFAEKVHASKCPMQFLRDLRAVIRSFAPGTFPQEQTFV